MRVVAVVRAPERADREYLLEVGRGVAAMHPGQRLLAIGDVAAGSGRAAAGAPSSSLRAAGRRRLARHRRARSGPLPARRGSRSRRSRSRGRSRRAPARRQRLPRGPGSRSARGRKGGSPGSSLRHLATQRRACLPAAPARAGSGVESPGATHSGAMGCRRSPPLSPPGPTLDGNRAGPRCRLGVRRLDDARHGASARPPDDAFRHRLALGNGGRGICHVGGHDGRHDAALGRPDDPCLRHGGARQ